MTVNILPRQVIAFQFENAMMEAGKRKDDAFHGFSRGCEHARRERTRSRAEIQKEVTGNTVGRKLDVGRQTIPDAIPFVPNISAQSFAISISNAVGCNKRNGYQGGERKNNLSDIHVFLR